MFKKKLPLLLIGILITASVALLYLNKPVFLSDVENKLYDIQMRRHHSPEKTAVPVVVDIDEESLKIYGQWPWPRYMVGRLLENIKASGIVSTGVDILFAEPDRTSLASINQAMKTYAAGQAPQIDTFIVPDLPAPLMNNDIALASTLSRGKIVLGYTMNFASDAPSGTQFPVPPIKPIVIQSPDALKLSDCLKKANGITPPLAILGKSAEGAGFFNAPPDSDGILRAAPLLMMWDNKVYPNLSLATLLNALGNPQVSVKLTPVGIESIRIGRAITIPLDLNGRFPIHYRGPGNQFQTISASLFLQNKIPKGSLQGKIAILGTSAAGLKDLRATPLDGELMGSQVHATIIDNIFQGDFFSRPDWLPGLEICLVMAFGMFMTLSIVLTKPLTTLFGSLLVGIGLWQASVYIFVHQHVFVSPLYPFIILALNFSLLSLFKYYFSEKDRIFIRNAFSNYVSEDLIEGIAKDPDMLKLGGQVKTATVLFCDLKNFTDISEKRTPYEIVDIMSRYFEKMTQFVFQHQGTLKDYIGDEMMALFGAPLSEKDHAENACRAALGMQQFLRELREGKYPELPPLSARVGVNTGEMLVGNIGSKYRFSYGIMGDNVNLGSRLEGLNKIYGTDIIIGQTTAEDVKDQFILRKLGAVKVKGKTIPQNVFELIAEKGQPIDPDREAAMSFYEQGYDLYKNQEWDSAISIFEKGQALWPHDLSFKVMIQRCGMYRRLPHMDDFDGVFIERRK